LLQAKKLLSSSVLRVEQVDVELEAVEGRREENWREEGAMDEEEAAAAAQQPAGASGGMEQVWQEAVRTGVVKLKQ
jgi:hypothetical protein